MRAAKALVPKKQALHHALVPIPGVFANFKMPIPFAVSLRMSRSVAVLAGRLPRRIGSSLAVMPRALARARAPWPTRGPR